jgi:hypothetical protein
MFQRFFSGKEAKVLVDMFLQCFIFEFLRGFLGYYFVVSSSNHPQTKSIPFKASILDWESLLLWNY